jgi:hypothetical protein
LLQDGTHCSCGGVCYECKFADGLGCASSVAHDRLSLHSSKALWSSGVQAMG